MRWMILIALGGCVNEGPTGPGVAGTSADVTTPPGDYAGYRVETICASGYADIAVVGTGSVMFAKIADISALTDDLHAQIADVASVWGWGGAGLVCDAGVGSGIDLSDWRDVDTVIARIGPWLHAHDYGLEIGISVGSIPVPVSGQ